MWIIGRDGTLTETGTCQIVKTRENYLDYDKDCKFLIARSIRDKIDYFPGYGVVDELYKIEMLVPPEGKILIAKYGQNDPTFAIRDFSNESYYNWTYPTIMIDISPHAFKAKEECDFVFDKLTTAIMENRPYFRIADAEKMFEAMVDSGWDTSLTNNEKKA